MASKKWYKSRTFRLCSGLIIGSCSLGLVLAMIVDGDAEIQSSGAGISLSGGSGGGDGLTTNIVYVSAAPQLQSSET